MLIDSEISGVDAGSAIQDAKRREARIAADLETVEKRLGQPGLSASERQQLQAQVDQLRTNRRATQETRDDQQASLATTPMVFDYGSGDLVPGFDGRSTLKTAFATGSENFMTAIGVVIILITTLLPWAILLVIGILAFRAIRRRVAGTMASSQSDDPNPDNSSN